MDRALTVANRVLCVLALVLVILNPVQVAGLVLTVAGAGAVAVSVVVQFLAGAAVSVAGGALALTLAYPTGALVVGTLLLLALSERPDWA